MPKRPPWWSWELELSPHVLRRMVDRRFNEADLRTMLEDASGFRQDIEGSGRWIIETRHDGDSWEVVVEPDPEERTLVVITAYGVTA
jgi:hypothetical protein